MVEFCRVISKISEYDLSLTVTVVPHSGMGVNSFIKFGNDDQKEKILKSLVRDRRLIAFALTEANTGSDVANHKTELTVDSSGRLILNGIKNFITNAAVSDTIIIVAKCPQLSKIPDGSVFIHINKHDQGVIITNPYDKAGIKGSVTSEIIMNDVVIPGERILGIPGKAMEYFNSIVDSGRIGVAAGCLGAMQRMIKYLQSHYKSIADKFLLSAEYKKYQMECMIFMAALGYDLKLPDNVISIGLTKIFCSVECWKKINEALLFEGFKGFLENKNLYRLFFDISIFRITEGPNEVLNFRSGIGLIMAMLKTFEGKESILPYIHPDLLNFGHTFNLYLHSYKEFMNDIKKNRSHFLESQLLLDRISKGALYLYLFFAVLLHSTACLKNSTAYDNYDKEKILIFCEKTTLDVFIEFERVRQTDDGLLSEIIERICINSHGVNRKMALIYYEQT